MEMRLLLLLSLITGGVASTDVMECREGWVNLVCRFSMNRNYDLVELITPKGKTIQSTEKNELEEKDGIVLFHDTTSKKVRVSIHQLQDGDHKKYRCRFIEGSAPPKEQKLELDKLGCQEHFIQIAYTTAQTTITCDYTRAKLRSTKRFFCKERESGSMCEDIFSSSSSPPKSNGTFTLTETSRGFSVSISNVSRQHIGVYWCGESNKRRTAARKIELKVKGYIRTFTRSPTVGQNLTYWCAYQTHSPVKTLICKGEDTSTCEHVASLTLWPTKEEVNNGKFSMKDDRENNKISITVRDVTLDDSGTYWCGAQSSGVTKSNVFFHRLRIYAVSPTSLPVLTTIQPSAKSDENSGSSWLVISSIVCASVLLLLIFILILFFVLKRFSSPRNAHDKSAEPQTREDDIHEENQEKPNSGRTKVKTIYSTIDVPKNPSSSSPSPSGSVLYASVTFKTPSHEPGSNPPDRSSSACEYSTVKFNERPNVTSPEDQKLKKEEPLYSTVNKPKK